MMPPQNQSSSRAWEALTPPLAEWLLEAVSSMGFERMTPVQASTIPLFTGNKDVVVEAVTGSGKTLSFLIPVIQRLLGLEEPDKKGHVAAIIVSPTRELATQIHSVLLSLLAFHPPSAAAIQSRSGEDDDEVAAPTTLYPSSTLRVIPQLLLGGTTTPAQDLAHFLTNSPNLLISTPGRLLELLSSPHVHCATSTFEALVLDEADRLLDLGFKEDLQKILQRIPKQRRTGLFSASVSEAVDQLVRVGLRNPVRIAVKVRGADGSMDGRTPVSLQMTHLTVPPVQRIPALLNLLRNLSPVPQKSIVYLSTCAAVDYFQHLLPVYFASSSFPITTIPLHGRHSAAIRSKNFARFLTTTTPTLLLTTDLAARGLDIPAVDLTVQLDPPSDPKTYLHRAGRAGRAGRRGLSVVFLLPARESEEYPRFLSVRRTPTTLLTNPKVDTSNTEEAIRCARILRAEVRKDRAIHDKAQRAFVSWVRSYSKHAAKGIFRVEELDWASWAEAWALLRMPKMPELKKDAGKWDKEAMKLNQSIDWDTFAYKDKERENKRKRELAAFQENAVNNNAVEKKRTAKPKSWSNVSDHKEVKEARRGKKLAKREAVRRDRMTDEEKAREKELQAMVEEVRRRGPVLNENEEG